jgi:hypothetical protein
VVVVAATEGISTNALSRQIFKNTGKFLETVNNVIVLVNPPPR